MLAYHSPHPKATADTVSGLIPTRTIAESVFVTHLLQEVRNKKLALDGTTEAPHRAKDADIPNKTTQALAYMAPWVDRLTNHLAAHAPAAAEESRVDIGVGI